MFVELSARTSQDIVININESIIFRVVVILDYKYAGVKMADSIMEFTEGSLSGACFRPYIHSLSKHSVGSTHLKSRWLDHVNLFFQHTVKKSRVDVKVYDFPTVVSSQRQILI
jgi:hypothetical protein